MDLRAVPGLRVESLVLAVGDCTHPSAIQRAKLVRKILLSLVTFLRMIVVSVSSGLRLRGDISARATYKARINIRLAQDTTSIARISCWNAVRAGIAGPGCIEEVEDHGVLAKW